MAKPRIHPGPDSARMVGLLRAAIGGGEYPVGQFLPCTRELGKTHSVSSETVRCALKILEADGLVAGVPRLGFQVVSLPDREDTNPRLLAYVSDERLSGRGSGYAERMFSVFQQVASRHGFALLALGADKSAAETIRHIRQAGAVGVILSQADEVLAGSIAKLRLPTVTAEFWGEASRRFDSVGQDNFDGALQAADYLVGRGHTRIAWVGPTTGTSTADERWGGAVVGLHRHGLRFAKELFEATAGAHDSATLQALLSRPGRPTGFICLWSGKAIGVARAAARQGLRIGRDLDLVGWTTEEQYDEYQLSFPEGQVPATVTWSITRLAENVLSRLAERRARPQLPMMRMIVETRLKMESAANKGVKEWCQQHQSAQSAAIRS